jgi:hypothetical protein
MGFLKNLLSGKYFPFHRRARKIESLQWENLNAFPNLYNDSTSGGIPPLESGWGTWSDPQPGSSPQVGKIDDYWYQEGAQTPDPYTSRDPINHTWDTVGDFMRTSQSKAANPDPDEAEDDTKFYTYPPPT